MDRWMGGLKAGEVAGRGPGRERRPDYIVGGGAAATVIVAASM
jgi:hypothetical protein